MRTPKPILFLLFFLAVLGTQTSRPNVRAQDEEWEDLTTVEEPDEEEEDSYTLVEVAYNLEGDYPRLRFSRQLDTGHWAHDKKLRVFYEAVVEPGPTGTIQAAAHPWVKHFATLQGNADTHVDENILARGKKALFGLQHFCVRIVGYQFEDEEYEEIPTPEKFCFGDAPAPPPTPRPTRGLTVTVTCQNAQMQPIPCPTPQ